MIRTYGHLHYKKESDNWVISDCEPHVSIRLKKIFPKIKITQLPPYQFANQQDICADLQWFTQRYPLTVSNSDAELLARNGEMFFEQQAELEKILLPDWVPSKPPGLRDGCELRFYQGQAVDVFTQVKRLLLVDAVGLGKTYESIGACLVPGTLPAAIVVQPHLASQWAEKINEFSYLTTHLVDSTKPYDLPPADIYIYKYTQLAGWVDVFAQGFFKAAIFDEIQELRRGTESNKGCGAKVLQENVEYVLGVTATPIYNYGIEIFNIVELIRPGFLGTRDEFIREWCDGNGKLVKDPEALGTYLRENYIMLRRTKKDVYGEVDQVNTIVEKVAYDAKAVKETEEIAEQLALTTLSGSFVERGRAARELDMLARQTTGVSKAKYVAQYVRILVESGEPVLLAGWHRDVYDIWLKELADLNPLMYTGSETPSQKNKNKDAFIKGESNLMIISLRSGAGLDGIQHRCSTVVIGELDWSPKVHEQVIGRVDRDGQVNPVMAIYLVSNFGSDPVIIDMLGLKNSQSSGIVDPGAELEIVHSDKKRIQTLAKSFLAKKAANINIVQPSGQQMAINM